MIINTRSIQPGWSYGKADVQYDNESLGSTKDGFKSEKSVKNSKKKEKNDKEIIIGSRDNGEHTDEQGWTTIEVNGSRKPKANNREQTVIDSIISSINIETTIVMNGAPEARIESPERESRCTMPDSIVKEKEIEFCIAKNIKQQLKPPQSPVGEEEEEETKEEDVVKKTDIKQSNKKNKKDIGIRNTTKRNNDGMEEEGRNNGNKERIITNEHERMKRSQTTTMATNGQTEATTMQTGTGEEPTSNVEDGNNGNDNEDKNKNNNNVQDNGEKSNKDNTDGGGGTQKVSIVLPTEMDTYAFTVAWRPEHKAGKDGKIIIKNLMREMAHRTPSIIFHPTNSATSPVPRDINNINNDFPKTSANYDDFFDQMRNRDNTNQRTFMKVTMPHNEKELQNKLSNYLFHNKLYMNSPFIDDNTLEQVGFIENGHSRLVYRPKLEKNIRNGLKSVMEGDMLTPQQVAQLKNLSSPIRVECHRGTVKAGAHRNQIVCEGIVLKTTKTQAKIVMELLAMLPETILGEHYRIIPKSLGHLLGYELYGQIVADTVNFQNKLRPITILHCHPNVFEDMYDSVKVQNSKHVEVKRFIIENCGAISIEETNESKDKGKYIVIVPEEKVDTARTAIGKMFQEFQDSGGRPAAMECLKEYQNFPLVNDNVTISGHAERLSQKIRERYRNRPKTPMNKSSSAQYSYHGSIATNEPALTQPTTPVPRSIIRKGKIYNNNNIQQWTQSPTVQQQRQHHQQQIK